jgi:XTP/dITP diphosphohydrolase
MPQKELVFATHNRNKAIEIQQMLGDRFLVKTLEDIEFHEEIIEDQPTLEGNARLKSDHIYTRFSCNVFSDDTGLEVDALNGEPGVYSARYAGEQKDNEANMNLLLERLANKADRSAQFRTVIALYWNDEFYQFEGIVRGTITWEKMGDKGFGYDPLFIPDGHSRTFAQMSAEEKNAISHRGRAIAKMVYFLSGV